MAMGLGVLRLPPEQFWRMTLHELFHAMEAINPRVGSKDAPARSDLERLIAAHPDDQERNQSE